MKRTPPSPRMRTKKRCEKKCGTAKMNAGKN